MYKYIYINKPPSQTSTFPQIGAHTQRTQRPRLQTFQLPGLIRDVGPEMIWRFPKVKVLSGELT